MKECKEHRYGKWEMLVISDKIGEKRSCTECGASEVRKIPVAELQEPPPYVTFWGRPCYPGEVFYY
jgi:hypothetical protein